MPQKPIAVIGTPGRVLGTFAKPTPAVFAATGHNTGNLAFQLAAWSVLDEEKVGFDFDFDPAIVRERCRMVCIPAANFLYNGFDLGGLADRLHKTGLPLMVLGLGAQAMRDVSEVRLQEGTERLLRLFAERCASIAVRGEYTASVLERYGVRNYRVLGCPSNFINPDPTMGAKILARWQDLPRDFVAYAPTFYSYNAKLESALYAALGQRVVEIVAQDPMPAVALARGDRTSETAAWLASKAGFLSDLTGGDQTRAVSILRAYFDADAWMESYRHVDAIVGTRIHGANLGWQAGRPALVISYDLRTEELATVMGVPMVKADRFPSSSLLEVMDERVQACASVYDARRRELAQDFMSLIASHGVSPSPHLAALASAKATTTPDHPSSKPVGTTAIPVQESRAWGFLEQYNRSRIAGWVAFDKPTPPRVEVKLDGVSIGVTTPSKLRPEVGPNAWEFDIPVPVDALTRPVMRVEAVLADTGKHLRNSPVVTSFAPDDAKKVLTGSDGWLFLQNDSNGVLDQIQGHRRLTSNEVDAWAKFLLEIDAAAQARGAHVLYLVVPNKECVFPAYLPNSFAVSENRPVRQLLALVDSLALRATRLVYPIEAIQAAQAHQTFPKGDSHWTDYGAMVALAELHAAGGIPGVQPAPEAAEYRSEYRNADLLSKLGGVCVEPRTHLVALPSPTQVSDNQLVNTGKLREYRSTSDAAEGRLLLIHDSFGEWLIPHLADRFQATTTLWGAGVYDALLDTSQPTTIIFERAERFLIIPPCLG